MSVTFEGAARRLDDIDLPKLGATIGVGEDVLHALLEVETRGTGFDKKGRVIMLFEPHRFYKNLRGAKLNDAIAQGLAYKTWGAKPYPSDSYPRIEKAILIDETAALKSASWGLPQLMGENFGDTKYSSPQEMVSAFAEDEENQLEAMIGFLKKNRIDVALRKIEKATQSGRETTPADWVPVVRAYNGPGYAKNEYHIRANNAYKRWLRIKDTRLAESMTLAQLALQEEKDHGVIPVDDIAEPAVLQPPITSATGKPEDPATIAAPGSEESSSQKIQQVAQSLGSKVMAGGLTGGGGVSAILLALTGAMKNPYVIAGIIIVILVGAWLWNESKKRQTGTQNKLIDAAASKDKNTVAIVPPSTPGG